jgi:protein SCO1/2
MKTLAAVVGGLLLGLAAFFAFTIGFGGGDAGAVQIGGPFALKNASGQTVTDKDFRGKVMLVFFGYTNCPDICPAELQKIGQAMDKLGPKASRLAPIFISVDPERDSPQIVDAYAKSANSGIVGLTGSTDEVQKAAKAYRVFFRKAPDKAGGSYVVDHSTITYVMGPDGKYLTHFTFETSPETMAATLSKYL